jgi:hypothetical protein
MKEGANQFNPRVDGDLKVIFSAKSVGESGFVVITAPLA